MHECKNAPMQECRNAGMQECRNAGMQLFSLVLASMLADLHLTRGQGGALNSITLTTAAAGGLAFGVADRCGAFHWIAGGVTRLRRRLTVTGAAFLLAAISLYWVPNPGCHDLL